MKELFFSLTPLFIVFEIPNMIHADKIISALKSKEYGCLTAFFGVYVTAYMFWTLTGLLTTQWMWFLPIIVLSLIPKSKLPIWYTMVDSLICILVLLGLIIDTFHVNIL